MTLHTELSYTRNVQQNLKVKSSIHLVPQGRGRLHRPRLRPWVVFEVRVPAERSCRDGVVLETSRAQLHSVLGHLRQGGPGGSEAPDQDRSSERSSVQRESHQSQNGMMTRHRRSCLRIGRVRPSMMT
ncbi:hypothetical protein AOLI_G00013850 [Acnodon oligacanthus]